MRCYNCGGNYSQYSGKLELSDAVIASYILDDVEYLKCDDCGQLLLPNETWEKADQERAKIKEELISNRPLSEFIGATEAAKILGMSRQALHKHRRIRRGFIHFTLHNGKIEYLKKSVELFRDTGDGRFPLKKDQVEYKTEPDVKYVVTELSAKPNSESYEISGNEAMKDWMPEYEPTSII